MSRLKIPVHIEAEVNSTSLLPIEEIRRLIENVLTSTSSLSTTDNTNVSDSSSQGHPLVFSNGPIPIVPALKPHLVSLEVVDLLPEQTVSFWQATLCIHPYYLIEQGPEHDYLQEGADGEEALPVAEQLELPNKQLSSLWQSIILEEGIKHRLLNYASSSLLFAEKGVHSDIISWNKMILLYGPPGKQTNSFIASS
jgi:hypothetical protein